MRSGGSVLEAPPGAEEGALPREHRPQAGYTELTRASSASRLCRTYASIVRVPAIQNGTASIVRRANLTYSASVKLNFGGIADMRSGGSVLKAPQRRRGGTPPPHASIVRKP